MAECHPDVVGHSDMHEMLGDVQMDALMVGHTYLYSEAVRTILEVVRIREACTESLALGGGPVRLPVSRMPVLSSQRETLPTAG